MNKKTLFITGGSGDIGREIINEFKMNGYNIISPTSSELDCSNEIKINNYFDSTKLNNIHSFVHCAGWNNPEPFYEITNETLIKSIFINSFSFIYILKKINNFLVDNESRISAISSLYGTFSRKNRLAYTSSKHSLNGIIKEIAIEIGSRGILCNTIAPGFIKTKMTYINNSPDIINDFKNKIPIGRLGTPKDIAKVVFFLTSNNNTYINGQNIVVDGGYSIGGFQNN
jgi:NAD(P)-dependent dehydrogenase (short-subunit alcohol dehydrogenase family)